MKWLIIFLVALTAVALALEMKAQRKGGATRSGEVEASLGRGVHANWPVSGLLRREEPFEKQPAQTTSGVKVIQAAPSKIVRRPAEVVRLSVRRR